MSIFSSFTSIFVRRSLTANLTVPLPSSSANPSTHFPPNIVAGSIMFSNL
jgi:hypothetical protein